MSYPLAILVALVVTAVVAKLTWRPYQRLIATPRRQAWLFVAWACFDVVAVALNIGDGITFWLVACILGVPFFSLMAWWSFRQARLDAEPSKD